MDQEMASSHVSQQRVRWNLQGEIFVFWADRVAGKSTYCGCCPDLRPYLRPDIIDGSGPGRYSRLKRPNNIEFPILRVVSAHDGGKKHRVRA